MPFITEELWSHLTAPDAGLLIRTAWPSASPDLVDRDAAAEMEWVVEAISAIRAVRSEMNVPAAARVPLLLKDADRASVERIERHREHFIGLARLDRIEPAPGTVPTGSIQAVVAGATLILPLGEIVDLAREKARLAKEIGRLDGEIAKFATKLANRQFLAKAKPEVIDDQREREAGARRDRDRLKTAYERLAAI
jgi:valyl-tRNA synthetase